MKKIYTSNHILAILKHEELVKTRDTFYRLRDKGIILSPDYRVDYENTSWDFYSADTVKDTVARVRYYKRKKVCLVVGCKNSYYAKNLCKNHYEVMRRATKT